LHEILRQPFISRIEPTKNIGKWFFISTLQQSKEASCFIDTDLPDYFKQTTTNSNTKVPGWEGPIRSKRHGETTISPTLIEKLRSRFGTAPTIDESVRRARKTPPPTIRYATGGPSFAAVAAGGEQPLVANTPEGKKRRKEPTPPLINPGITTAREPVQLTSTIADITSELNKTLTSINELVSTLRKEVDDKISELTTQIQMLRNQPPQDQPKNIEDTRHTTDQQILEQTVHNAVNAALEKITAQITAKVTTDITALITAASEKTLHATTALLRDRDTYIHDELQGIRDNVAEQSQQPRHNTPRKQAPPPQAREQYYTPHRKKPPATPQRTPQRTVISYAFCDGDPPE
jgi:hypothetical protein